nr:MAG TPA: leucine-rich repeat protein [Caudoviricetes sp.]
MKALTLEQAKKMMEQNGGNLNLSHTPITALPEGLTVGGWLDLSHTQITALPEGLTVGGSLYLSGTPITALPEGLTVGGSLDLSYTPITALPEGLTVGGWLYLRGTPITALPEGLTVGGWLDLSHTPITALPEGLTVGGELFLNGTNVKKTEYKKLRDGDYVPKRYIYADGILTHIKGRRKINGYTFYRGRIKGQNVITDGKHYAHCKNIREGIKDLAFKTAKDRGIEQYKGLTLSSELAADEIITMYRVITGACRAGTEMFVNSLGKLKEKYTIKEAIEITKGQYNSRAFESFFITNK